MNTAYAGASSIHTLFEDKIAYYNVSFRSMTLNLHFISVKLVIRAPSVVE